MQSVFEKIIEKLKEVGNLEISMYGGRCNGKTLTLGYKKGIENAIEIVKHESERYEECYKDCRDCEAYNKEKHHCPKFCKVIKETVKEIEENHNGWIPCSEHQPEEAGTYNVTAYDGRILRSTHAKWQPRLKSWNLTGTMAYWKIIAWMELPSAYRPKEK